MWNDDLACTSELQEYRYSMKHWNGKSVQPGPFHRVNHHIFSAFFQPHPSQPHPTTPDKRLRCHLQTSSQQGAPLRTLHLLAGLIQIWQNLSIRRIQPDTTPDVTPFGEVGKSCEKLRGARSIKKQSLKWTKDSKEHQKSSNSITLPFTGWHFFMTSWSSSPKSVSFFGPNPAVKRRKRLDRQIDIC